MMGGNSFGKAFVITTFGESHGPAIGVIVDGCPAGLKFNLDFIQSELDRRRPGQSPITTQRKELDQVEVLSGVFEGKTTGTPIGMLIANQDQREKDYQALKETFRPSHADYTYQKKYGVRDYRGGGRSSARETAARVAAGALAKLLLQHWGVTLYAYVDRVAHISVLTNYHDLDLSETEKNIMRCPDPSISVKMVELVDQARKAGDTLGGTIFCVVKGCPTGLGEPVFDKLQAALAGAMLGINAAQGFEYGSGFDGSFKKGSENNDAFVARGDSKIGTLTNNSGGIQGGISNGEDIYFRVAFKPVATIMQDQASVDEQGNMVTVTGRGRHDPCVLPRAVPIVEAMAALVLTDFYLRNTNSMLRTTAV